MRGSGGPRRAASLIHSGR